MENFPQIRENEFALMFADRNTGILLDEKFMWNFHMDKKVYKIFNSFEKVKEYVEPIISSRSDIDYVVYDCDENVISFSK
jgi:hypothetical protein